MDITSCISEMFGKVRIGSKTSTYLTIFVLCSLIVTSQAQPFKLRSQVKNCKGFMKAKCLKISTYCHPQILKRSIYNEDFAGEAERVISRRNQKKGFRVPCWACTKFCWT